MARQQSKPGWLHLYRQKGSCAMLFKGMLALAIVSSCCLSVSFADGIPGVMMSDSFLTETVTNFTTVDPLSGINFNRFHNWNVTQGSVDLVNLNGGARALWFQNYTGATPNFSFVDLD